MKVVIDGQITGNDGIGRYTRCLTRALTTSGTDLELRVVPPAGVPRYSHAEGDHLLAQARRQNADVLHLLDYRTPLSDPALPVVATVHDIRLGDPAHCYSDVQFTARFGVDGMDGLTAAVRTLRQTAPWPPGIGREPSSLHEEFVGRMLCWTAATATAIITPTRAVSDELARIAGMCPATRISPYGVDHLHGPPLPTGCRPALAGRYLLYVGQARPHKGVPALTGAYVQSGLADEGVRLALVGRDFAPGTAGEELARREGVVAVGEVTDAELAAWYAGACALAHLSAHEGFGLPPAEALSFGTRVVAADIPVLREVLGRHAVFVDPGDPPQVAVALRTLIGAPDTPQERAARITWARRYRWSAHAADLLAVYRQAAG